MAYYGSDLPQHAAASVSTLLHLIYYYTFLQAPKGPPGSHRRILCETFDAPLYVKGREQVAKGGGGAQTFDCVV